jgi:transposase-like protein
VATLVRTIFDQPAAEEVAAQHGRVVDSLEAKHPDAAAHLDEAKGDLLAFTGFPRDLAADLSNNPQERLNKRSDGAPTSSGFFPTEAPSSAWSVPC